MPLPRQGRSFKERRWFQMAPVKIQHVVPMLSIMKSA